MSLVCKFLNDEFETVFWESKTKTSKLLKPKADHRKYFRKWFRSYAEVKNECCQRLKIALFTILQIFERQSGNDFLANEVDRSKLPKSKVA